MDDKMPTLGAFSAMARRREMFRSLRLVERSGMMEEGMCKLTS